METQVVVIGGGITGAGILRDLALRGIAAVLVEKGDLVNGTSARFHGLLHSGARYAVVDPASARECRQENLLQKRLASSCIEDSGGVFLQIEGDDPAYVSQWLTACQAAGIDVREIDRQSFLKGEPHVSRRVQRVFSVPDAAVDGFALVQANVRSAESLGARVMTYTQATGMAITAGRISGVKIRHRSGESSIISCQMVVNAAGPWTGQIAALAGLELQVVQNKGALLVYNQRLTKTIINRCQAPGDGDILVPHHNVAVYGTTSLNVKDPDADQAVFREVNTLLSIGRQMIPSLSEARILRAFAGVRPLYQPGGDPVAGIGRELSRDFFIIDHDSVDGLPGLASVVGGKFTTYRLMAEKMVDLVAGKLACSKPCLTAITPLPAVKSETGQQNAGAVAGQLLCECEQVTDLELARAIQGGGWTNLNDLRRKTRFAMGTCQGTYCAYRAMEMVKKMSPASPNTGEMLKDLLDERWKGMRAVIWGETVKEAELMRNIYANILNIEELEDGDEQQI